MIFIRPGSGLCNRLRVIASAVKLARECKTQLEVDWFRCPLRRWAALCGMRARFSDLFQPIDSVRVCERIRVRNDFPWNWAKYSRRNTDFFCEADRGAFIDAVKQDPEKNRWLWTCFNFYESVDYDWLHLLPAIEKRVDDELERKGRSFIGLHVRRTDNREAAKASPLELFFDKVDFEIDNHSCTRFFLATDDLATKEAMINRYGERIWFQTDVAPRYTIKGEQDAVVDLMLLSRARKIYGSYWSSFSEVASQIGKSQLEILVKSGVELTPWIEK